MTADLFAHQNVPMDILAERAYNFRWAETDKDVIPLTAADPDFAVAKEIRQAVADYALSGVFSYGPHQGLPEFKNALAVAMSERRGYDLTPEHILPIDSVASGMYIVARTYLEPGDEAIIFDPVDFLFEQSVLAAGAKVIRCPFDAEKGEFRLDLLPEMVSEKTKMIGVCNPHNPLGRLMRKDELAQIAEFANERDMWIMNDEIWSDVVFPELEFASFHHLEPALSKKVITVYGYSKSFGLAGLRVGAVVAPDQQSYDEIVAASNVMTTAGGVATLSQVAATTAMTQCWYWVDGFIEHLTKNRDYAVERLNAMPGITCRKPEATYLLFPNVEGTGLDSETLVAKLLEEKIAVVPGNERFFGPGAKGHIRICFATSFEILKEGLDRIEKALSKISR